MAQKVTLEEFEKFIRQIKILIGCFVILFVLPSIIYAIYSRQRSETFNDSHRYRPPPKVEEYASRNGADYVPANPVQGQVVYVPAYSHIYRDGGDPYLLTITLSVRNTSLDREIVVKSVRYFDTKGKEVKSYLTKPIRLPALATAEFLVERDDATGGSGANFLVEWVAKEEVTEPIIEALMIDTTHRQGISFARVGKPVRGFAQKKTMGDESEDTSTSSEKTNRGSDERN